MSLLCALISFLTLKITDGESNNSLLTATADVQHIVIVMHVAVSWHQKLLQQFKFGSNQLNYHSELLMCELFVSGKKVYSVLR